jgi:hypothetical protein
LRIFSSITTVRPTIRPSTHSTSPKCIPPRHYSSSPSFPSPSLKIPKQQTGQSYHSDLYFQHVPPTAALFTTSKANALLPTSQPLTQTVSVRIHDLLHSIPPVQAVSLRFVLGLDLAQQRRIYRRLRRGMIAIVLGIKGPPVPRLGAHLRRHLQIRAARRVLELNGKPPLGLEFR